MPSVTLNEPVNKTFSIVMGILLSFCLVAGVLAYITPPDSWNLRDYYDIVKVNEINGSVSNFTTYETAEGDSITDFSVYLDDTDTNASTACNANEYLDGSGTCVAADSSGVCAANAVCEGGHDHGDIYYTETETDAAYVSRDTWTDIDSYPSACNSTSFVRTIGDTLTCEEPAYIADTQADEVCDGTTTYLDGEGNCDDISGVYVQAADWTTIDSYPAACPGDEAVNTIGDTSVCIDTIENATKWGDCARGGDCIVSADVLDIDDIDVEADMNTYIDIGGDTATGNITIDSNSALKIDSDNYGVELGEDADVNMYWDGTYFIIET